MFKKKFYFLSGLPRSGNTLLGSILNQNKNISVTGNSPVSEMFYCVETVKKQMAAVENFPDTKSFSCVQRNIFKNYYSTYKSKHIIDRSCWGTPDNLEILKKYSPNDIKIIVLTRSLDEVLASFIKWSQENPKNFLEQYSTVEEKCDFLMNQHGQIMKQLYSIHNLSKEENKKYALFVKYNDLVNGPKKEIERIYDFLKIRKYNHYYTNLLEFECNGIKYNDSIFGNNLHYVKKQKVEKTNYNPTDYIPQYIIDKYKQFY